MNEKNKAAIITWCYNNGKTNYGQILQCYAMQQMVKKCGFDPIVVRYRRLESGEAQPPSSPEERDQYEFYYRISKIEGCWNNRIGRFVDFIRRNIVTSKQCYSIQEIEEETQDCSILICGSDQIWNPLWFDEVYALNFGRDDQKRIAYAPSGVLDETRIESINTYKRISELIEHFDLVTVREKKSVEILKKYSEKPISEAIDPALLLGKDDWDVVASPRLCSEPYLFCYSLGRLRSHKVILRYLAQKYKVSKVLFIASGHYDEEETLETEGIFQSVDNAGPAEFLSLIKYSNAVCTDSFHGIALSIIYEKQFYMIERQDPDIELWGSAERQKNLMRKVGLSGNRLVNSIKDVEVLEDIPYETILIDRSLPKL